MPYGTLELPFAGTRALRDGQARYGVDTGGKYDLPVCIDTDSVTVCRVNPSASRVCPFWVDCENVDPPRDLPPRRWLCTWYGWDGLGRRLSPHDVIRAVRRAVWPYVGSHHVLGLDGVPHLPTGLVEAVDPSFLSVVRDEQVDEFALA